MAKKRKWPQGRSGGRHVALHHEMLHSAAYRGLSVNARSLLVEVASLYNGGNNGELFVSVRDAAKVIGLRDTGAANAALKELVNHGFLRVTSPGSFTVKLRHATQYRLTWVSCDDRTPTNNWRDWRPTLGSAAWKRIERLRGSNLRCGKTALSVLETATRQAKEAVRASRSVPENDTAAAQFQQVTPSPSVPKSDTQIIYQGVCGERAPLDACRAVRAAAKLRLGRIYGDQRHLARAAGISEAKLSRFLHDERGRRTLTVDELERLNRALAGLDLKRVGNTG
jgi:hypothetical protein